MAMWCPIALVQEGDMLLIDVPGRQLNIEISEAQLQHRLRDWQPRPKSPSATGVLAKYARLVSDASQGAITLITQETL